MSAQNNGVDGNVGPRPESNSMSSSDGREHDLFHMQDGAPPTTEPAPVPVDDTNGYGDSSQNGLLQARVLLPQVLFPVQFRQDSELPSLQTSASNNFGRGRTPTRRPSLAFILHNLRREYGQTDLMMRRASSILFHPNNASLEVYLEPNDDEGTLDTSFRPFSRRHSSVALGRYPRRRSSSCLSSDRVTHDDFGLNELELMSFYETHSTIDLPTFISPSFRNVIDDMITEFEIFRSMIRRDGTQNEQTANVIQRKA